MNFPSVQKAVSPSRMSPAGCGKLSGGVGRTINYLLLLCHNHTRQRFAALNVEEAPCRNSSAVSYKSVRAKAMNASFKLLSITRLLIFDSYGVLLLNSTGYLKPRCLMSGLNSSWA